MFSGLTDKDLTWQINANNIGQAFIIPFSAWLLTTKRGLRNTMLWASALQVMQAVIWAFVPLGDHSFRKSGFAHTLLALGAAVGGAGTAFTQGAPSRLSGRTLAQRARQPVG